MHLTPAEYKLIIPALEEADKSFTSKMYRDLAMQAQTNVMLQMGWQNPDLMAQGFGAYQSALTSYQTDLFDIHSRFQAGTYDMGKAMTRFKQVTGLRYEQMFRAGTLASGNIHYDEVGLTRKDQAFISKARRMEMKHFRKFLTDIKNPNHIPKHPYAERLRYYGESGKAQFYNGQVAGMGTEMDIYWILGNPPTDNCVDCHELAGRKWNWETLPTVPRGGDTRCLWRCYCHLEFKNKKRGDQFDIGGKATSSTLRAPGRYGRVFDSTGAEVLGDTQRLVEGIYSRMNRARQMIDVTKGAEKLSWIKTRQGLNQQLIDLQKARNYRTVPGISVKDLTSAIRDAQKRGGMIIDDLSTLRVGDEMVFVRSDFSSTGIVGMEKGRLVFRGADGKVLPLTNDTDVAFLLRRARSPEESGLIVSGAVPKNTVQAMEDVLKLIPKEQRQRLWKIVVTDKGKFKIAAANGETWNAFAETDFGKEGIYLKSGAADEFTLLHEIGHNVDTAKLFLQRKRLPGDDWYSDGSFWRKSFDSAKAGTGKYLRSNSLVDGSEYFSDCYASWIKGRFGNDSFYLDAIEDSVVTWFDRNFAKLQGTG